MQPRPAEVAEIFLTESRALESDERRRLRRRGVSESALDRDPGQESAQIRAARGVTTEHHFDFAEACDPQSIPVFVACARNWRGVASDIVAFDTDGRYAVSWLGRESFLGAHHLFAPRLGNPLRVFRDRWAWLLGDRDGVVIVDWRRAPALLEGVTIGVDDLEFGRVLRRRLTRPPPPIVVRRSAESSA